MATPIQIAVVTLENPIEKLLKEHGLTPAKLAVIVGRSASAISALRRGEVQSVSDEIAHKIERAFRISAAQLQENYKAWKQEQEEEMWTRLGSPEGEEREATDQRDQ